MLKMTVSPLDSRNSSIPNRTPLSVEMTISSSTAHSQNDWMDSLERSPVKRPASRPGQKSRREIRTGTGKACRSGPLHLAGGRQHRLRGVDLGHQVPAPTGTFLVERLLLLVGQGAERGDVDRLEELVVVLAHEGIAAVVGIDLHVLEGCRHFHRIDRV